MVYVCNVAKISSFHYLDSFNHKIYYKTKFLKQKKEKVTLLVNLIMRNVRYTCDNPFVKYSNVLDRVTYMVCEEPLP